MALHSGEFANAFRNASDVRVTTRSVGNISNMLVGDWGVFENALAYRERHGGVRGAYSSESVVKVGDDRYWGHPIGVRSAAEWRRILAAAVAPGFDPARVPGFNGEAKFIDVGSVAQRILTLRHQRASP